MVINLKKSNIITLSRTHIGEEALLIYYIILGGTQLNKISTEKRKLALSRTKKK